MTAASRSPTNAKGSRISAIALVGTYVDPQATILAPSAALVRRDPKAPKDGMDEDYDYIKGLIGECFYRASQVKANPGVVVDWICAHGG